MTRAPTLAARVAFVAVTLLVCLLALPADAVSGGGVTSTMRVAFTQVLHRHGARSPVASYNESVICRHAPCGYLTEAGSEQLVNIGAFLRERYNDESIVVEPFFPSEAYDISAVYTRSTDVFRTLQSAEAFLHGLFPSLDSSFPAIHTMALSDDFLFTLTTQPWLLFYFTGNPEVVRAATDPVTDSLYPGDEWRQLTELGAKMGAEGLCSDYAARSDCAMALYDSAACWEAMEELDPDLKENARKMQKVSRAFFSRAYTYSKTDDLSVRQGGRGREILNDMLKNVDDYMAGTNTYRMMHYSAHDSSLASVWGTLGDESDTGKLPPFAQTFMMELLQEPAAATPAYHVRIERLHPGQTHADLSVTGLDDTWAMKCMSADGQVYLATDNTCPLDDFKAYYATTAPTDPRGYCYMDEQTLAIMNCPSGGVTTPNAPALQQPGASAPALSSSCMMYRNVCPAYSCDDGYVLEKSTLQCVCSTSDACVAAESGTAGGSGGDGVVVNVNFGEKSVSAGATAGIAIATFCVGALIAAGVVAAIFVCCCGGRKSSGESFKSEGTP